MNIYPLSHLYIDKSKGSCIVIPLSVGSIPIFKANGAGAINGATSMKLRL